MGVVRNIIIVLIALSLSLVIFAQDDSTPLMNWCDEGGSMYGHCTIPGDEALTNYLWEVGWYLAAVDRYEIALEDIPDRYIKKDAPFDEETADTSSSPKFKCKAITLPSLPGNAEYVTGELIHEGVTYQSVTIPAATYTANAAGETYNPEIIGDKHKVKIISKDGAFGVIKTKTYNFNCDGTFDATAGGIL